MAITAADWGYGKKLTGTDLGTSSNQVILITEDNVATVGDVVDFWTSVKNGGGDIRVCENSDGTNELPLHVVVCNTSTQELRVYCRKPSYASLSREVYLFAGNAAANMYAATDTFGRNAVYQDWLAVYNFEFDANDDTVNARNGTVVGATLQASGGYEFAGTNRIEVPDAVGEGINNDHVVYFEWLNNGSLGDGHFFDSRQGSATGIDIEYVSSALGGEYDSGPAFVLNGSTFPSGSQIYNAWYVRRADDTATIYVDTQTGVTTTVTGSMGRSASPVKIGNQANDAEPLGAGRVLKRMWFMGMSLDATHISILQNNFTNPSTFWTQDPSFNPGGGGTITIPLAAETYSYIGQAATVSLTGTISANLAAQSFSYTGNAITVDLTGEIQANLSAGSYSYAQNAITVETVSTLEASLASTNYSYAAQSAVIDLTGQINANLAAESYSYAPQAAVVTLQGQVNVNMQPGSYAYNVFPATITIIEPYVPKPARTIYAQPKDRKIAIGARKRKIFYN